MRRSITNSRINGFEISHITKDNSSSMVSITNYRSSTMVSRINSSIGDCKSGAVHFISCLSKSGFYYSFISFKSRNRQ